MNNSIVARFGFNNGSSIDSLLDKEDVSVEALLDEDDLLQECKAQNTRLTEFFARIDVLKVLLGYVTGQTEGGEEKGRFKYPYIATEVLCSEIWTIVDTCVQESEQLLVPFWETVLDRPPEEMKAQTAMASHFAKISSAFLSKKPAEMIEFIQRQPNIVERLLQHIETSPFVDILVRIIQLDDQAVGNGVLEWLSSQGFIGRLVDLLSPTHSSAVHSIVTELIKGIISMATPSPTAGLTDNNSNGPASNRFARELAKQETMEKLFSFILHDGTGDVTREAVTSSVVHSIAVVIELIRKNNSDYFEPYLFHTLRNRLIQVQQQIHTHGDADATRHALEGVMQEMVNRMGVVHLGPVLEIACLHLGKFHHFLKEPRSLQGPISTTVGAIIPLTLERYRILELFAELLHCSNMSLLNRAAMYNHLYDSEGRLQGGLSSLEELASVVAMNSASNNDRDRDLDSDPMDDDEEDEDEDYGVPDREGFSVRMVTHDESMLDSDEEMEAASTDEEMEEIAMYDPPTTTTLLSPPSSASDSTRSPSPSLMIARTLSTSPPPSEDAQDLSLHRAESRAHSHSSRRNSRSRKRTMDRESTIDDAPLPIGEQLKKQFLEMGLFSTLLDLFFDFPWNNFLHSTVYDLIHQVLTGNVETGRNRELALSLFRDAKIMNRIVGGQKRNDAGDVKGGRLGYMGHLTLIAEDVITALEHFPPDLRLTIIQQSTDQERDEWDEYVRGRYKETKANDTRLLGGGKPVVSARNVAAWKDDEPVVIKEEENEAEAEASLRSEFRRVGSTSSGERDAPKNTAHFLPDEEDDEDDASGRASHFARYLEQEIHSSADSFNSSDEDEDDEGWLSQSAFVMREPPRSPNSPTELRRPLSRTITGFDDAFAPSSSSNPFPTDFPEDDFGPFSDNSNPNSDPFGSFSSSSLSEDDELGSFDFGDFQSAEAESGGSEMLLTPISAGSWTFATSSSKASSEGDATGNVTPTNFGDDTDEDEGGVDKDDRVKLDDREAFGVGVKKTSS